ncbi:MAG: cyclic nucleotide-binding domain-containing protein [Vicinamibacterales bacterium]
MRWVRGTLAFAWLVLIASMFYDPVTPSLTRPDNLSSPFRLTDHQVIVQGKVLDQEPYPMGVRIFWTMLFPWLPIFLMVLGHEAWRRVCPLSFFSQIPRMLGTQSRLRRFNRKSGQVEEKLRLVEPDSWLKQHFWYVQFGLLATGLCLRLVAINSSGPALGTFFLVVIASAIVVGYRYGGKTWCNYICPVSVVQRIYTEPHGLFESQAHLQKQPVTQSMCRVSTGNGVQSNCVGCLSPCPDIDLERAYWQTLETPGRRFAYYGYFGLVWAFYTYYFLYAGNWDYYYSGAWTHEANTLTSATLLGPGFYFGGMTIPIPKLIAAPLTLAAFIFGAYGLGCGLERLYAWTMARRGRTLDRRMLLHRTFAVAAFLTINSFYFFGGRPNIRLMPDFLQSTLNAAIVTFSTLWLVRVLRRSPARYQRESVVNTLLKQLKKFKTDFSRFLDGRSLDDLGPDEVYLLAKTAPGISQEQKHGVYKDVLREWISTGRTNSSQSLTMLAELRLQVGVTEDQHHAMLQELGIEDPSLLDPDARKEQENELRLENYGTALQALRARAVERGADPDRLASAPEFSAELRTLQSVYQISAEEHVRARRKIDQSGAGWREHTLQLLREVGRLSAALYSLKHLTAIAADPLCRVLSRGIREQRHRHAGTLLRVAASAEDDAVLLHFARALYGLIGEEAKDLARSKPWKRVAHAGSDIETRVSDALSGWPPIEAGASDGSLGDFTYRDLVTTAPDPAAVYASFARDPHPVVSGAAIMAMARTDRARAASLLRVGHDRPEDTPWFVQEAADAIGDSLLTHPAGALLPRMLSPEELRRQGYEPLPASTIVKLAWLTEIDLFEKMPLSTLAELARHGELRRYPRGEILCKEGQRSDGMFLLLSGTADVFLNRDGGVERVSGVSAGQTVGEMGVFTKKPRAATVVIGSETADVLAFGEEHLDTVWENPHASRGVLLRVYEYYQQARNVEPASPPPPQTESRVGAEKR